MFFRFQLVLQYPEDMHNVQQCSLPQGCLFVISSNTYFTHLLQYHHQLLCLRIACPSSVDDVTTSSAVVQQPEFDSNVPPEWLGITCVAPLKLQFREGLPRLHKPPARLCDVFVQDFPRGVILADKSPELWTLGQACPRHLRSSPLKSSMYSHKVLPLCVLVMIVLELITS
jgi:hypothetical protein